MQATEQQLSSFLRMGSLPSAFGDDDHFIKDLVDRPAEDMEEGLKRILWYIEQINDEYPTHENLVDGLAMRILQGIGYEKDGMVRVPRSVLPLHVCNDNTRNANSNIGLVHRKTGLVAIIVENKSRNNNDDLEPQLFAEAIAVYQYNNARLRDLGLDSWPEMEIPCISMVGTVPAFYKIHVRGVLNDAIIAGIIPPMPTIIQKCEVPNPNGVADGMRFPEFRKLSFQYFDTFWHTVDRVWNIWSDRLPQHFR